MKLKIISAVLMAAMCSLIFTSPAFAETDIQTEAQKQPAAQSGEYTAKNETVYAKLNEDGSVGSIYVVNQLIGTYTDYGNYTSVKNLSTGSEPTIDGDKITFPDADVEGGLYYQGETDGELPMAFNFRYLLDGEPVDAESLGGSSGHLTVTIHCAQNENCDARIREGLTAQIMLNLDLGLAQNIKADDATSVITGNTMNLSFTVLPGESGNFTIDADVSDFEMDAVSITMLQANLGGYAESIDEYEEGFDDMADCADDMVDGTTELKDGVSTLADGIEKLSAGLKKLKSSGNDMQKGMKQYSAGLRDYTQGVCDMATASGNIKSGLNTLADNGDMLASSLSQISGNLSAMSDGELYALAQSLSSSSDPSVQALAQGTLAMLEGMGDVSDGLYEVSGGLDNYVSGVKQAADGYSDFDAGLSQLAMGGDALVSGYGDITAGFDAYVSGVGKSASGASSISKAVGGLPDDIQELIDGQTEFRNGITDAKEELLSETKGFTISDPVSFASPDKNHPGSVQYVFMTPSITKADEKEEPQETENKDTFLTRFSDLFN